MTCHYRAINRQAPAYRSIKLTITSRKLLEPRPKKPLQNVVQSQAMINNAQEKTSWRMNKLKLKSMNTNKKSVGMTMSINYYYRYGINTQKQDFGLLRPGKFVLFQLFCYKGSMLFICKLQFCWR